MDESTTNAGSLLDSAELVDRVRAVLLPGGVPFDDLEDGVQQVRLKLLESFNTVRDPNSWSAVVASRVAADWHRVRSKDARLHIRIASRWMRTAPTERTEEDRVLALSVAEGLEQLTHLQRQVLMLRFYSDLTVAEIASQIGVAEGTVKSRLYSAVGVMRSD